MIDLESYANSMYQGKMEKILLEHVKGTVNEKCIKKILKYKHKSQEHGFYYLERMVGGFQSSFNRVYACDVNSIQCLGYLSDLSERDLIILRAAQYKRLFDNCGDMFLREDPSFKDFVYSLEKLSDSFANTKEKTLEEVIKIFTSAFTLEDYKNMLEDKKLEEHIGKDIMHLEFKWTEEDSPKLRQWAHRHYYKKCWKLFKRWQKKVLFNYSMYANKHLKDWAYFEYSNKEQRKKEFLGDIFRAIATQAKILYKSHVSPESDSIGYIDGPWFFAYKIKDTILSMLTYTVLFGHICDDSRLDQVVSMDEALTKLKNATDLEEKDFKADEEVADKIKKKYGIDISLHFTIDQSFHDVWLERRKLAEGETPTGFVKGNAPYEIGVITPALEKGYQYFNVSEELSKEIDELYHKTIERNMKTLSKEVKKAYKSVYSYIGENSLEWSD